MPTHTKQSERFDLYQDVTDQIVRALENGTVPWRKPWTASGPGELSLHRNFSSKRAYRGVNQMLLDLVALENGYQTPFWVTFKGAQKLGGQVRKGEKSTIVVFWKRIRVEGEDAAGDKTVKVIPLLRYFRVFNVEQCDGIEMPEAPAEDPGEAEAGFNAIEAAQAVIDGMPNAPKILHGGRDATYNRMTDVVRLPAPEAFDAPAEYYSAAFHELIHATGHQSRLARKDLLESAGFASVPYSREELTAEMGAAMLCAYSGIEQHTIENSAAYIEHWLKVLREDNRMVVVAAGRAHAAADHILGVTYEAEAGE